MLRLNCSKPRSLNTASLRVLASILAPASTILLPSVAQAASMSGPVAKDEWTTSPVPSYIDMFLGLPDTLPEKPPILVNIHSCGNNAGGQWSYDGFAPIRAAMDSVGFIMILPQQSRNCWNVGAPESLTHDGGGDTGAIVQMVKYALEKYNGDPTRVYVMGGSGGGMCTQALLAVYPEIFKAGHERAGVPAGCWAEGYNDGMQWSDACAGGSVNKTAQEWGDYVRAINPNFTGPRPRIQLNHGNADETINFNNFGEAIEQWTNVLGLDLTPTSTDMGFQGTAKPSTGAAVTYDRQFWKDECGFTVMEAWEALNQRHGMGYESEAILKWFGLDVKREQDPWDEACGGMVSPDDSGSTQTSSGDTSGANATIDSTGTSGGNSSTAASPSSNQPDTSTGPVTTTTTGGAPTGTAATSSPAVATSSAQPTNSNVTAPSTAGTAPSTTATTSASTDTASSNGGMGDDSRSGGGCGVTRTSDWGFAFSLVGLGLLVRRRRSV